MYNSLESTAGIDTTFLNNALCFDGPLPNSDVTFLNDVTIDEKGARPHHNFDRLEVLSVVTIFVVTSLVNKGAIKIIWFALRPTQSG